MATTISAEAVQRPRLTVFRQALLSFYWLATNVLWSAVLLVTMPSQIKSAVGEREPRQVFATDTVPRLSRFNAIKKLCARVPGKGGENIMDGT